MALHETKVVRQLEQPETIKGTSLKAFTLDMPKLFFEKCLKITEKI